MTRKFYSVMIIGMEPIVVEVSSSIHNKELSSFNIVGMKDAAIRETRVRVQAAITNSGFVFPKGSINVALNRRLVDLHLSATVDGAGFDLAIALAILEASGQLGPENEENCFAFSELSLGGQCRPCRGAILAAKAVKALGNATLLCAPENTQEAILANENVVSCPDLARAVRYVALGQGSFVSPVQIPTAKPPQPDMKDIRGQRAAKRMLEIAAAGGFNVMLIGPTGSGGTMMARRFAGILPPMTQAEAREVLEIHSVAGLSIGASGFPTERPFRAPHHSVTAPGLIGGGSTPRPGEASLAHNGVLFLDQVPEFHQQALEYMREVNTDRSVVLARASGSVRFPANAQIIGSMDACPCGRLNSGSSFKCRCDEAAIARMYARAAPVLDLCAVRIAVPLVDMRLNDRPYSPEVDGDDTATMQARVIAARQRQAQRGMLNRDIKATFDFLRIARTIADLDGDKEITDKVFKETMGLMTGAWSKNPQS